MQWATPNTGGPGEQRLGESHVYMPTLQQQQQQRQGRYQSRLRQRSSQVARQQHQLAVQKTAGPHAKGGGRGRHHHHAANVEHAASSPSCAVHCRMAEWTWEEVKTKIADPALGFTMVEQGMLRARLRPLGHDDLAFYLGDNDNGIVKGQLMTLLPPAGGCMSST
jgi:hypothetical protein